MLKDAPLPFIVVFALGIFACRLYYARQISFWRDAAGLSEERRKKLRIEKFLKKFPPKKFGRKAKYELIWEGSGAVFLHDFRTNLRHHIANPKTMSDLRFDWHSIRTVSKEELDKIEQGESIDTGE